MQWYAQTNTLTHTHARSTCRAVQCNSFEIWLHGQPKWKWMNPISPFNVDWKFLNDFIRFSSFSFVLSIFSPAANGATPLSDKNKKKSEDLIRLNKNYETKRTYVDLCEKTNKQPNENQLIELNWSPKKRTTNEWKISMIKCS